MMVRRGARGRRPGAGLAVAALLAAGCSPGQAPPRFDTAPVTRGDLAERVTASGTLSALVSVDVGSQVSGRIASLHADFNDAVRKGQLLAELDASVYAAQLEQARGELASARATVVLKRQNLERKRTLVPQRAASQSDLDAAEAELAQAEAAVLMKEASLQSARVNLGYCRIASPVDGVVISRKVDVGQTLAAAMTTPVLYTIAQDITRMHISAAVSEADIGQVRAGQPVDFTVDAFPDEVFRGKVVQVRMAPTTSSNVVTYEVMIDVDNPERKLFPGMTAEVAILVAERRGALRVPNAALRYTPPEGTRYDGVPPRQLERSQRLAYALANDGARLRPVVVTAGITDGTDTELVEGGVEGLRLVTGSSAPKAASQGGPGGGPPPP